MSKSDAFEADLLDLIFLNIDIALIGAGTSIDPDRETASSEACLARKHRRPPMKAAINIMIR